jgi:hypothetical protein
MINKYSFKYKLAEKIASFMLKFSTNQYFFSTKVRSSCLIKIVFRYQNKVLLAKKIQSDSLSKVCLPYGYVDLSAFEDNIDACINIAYDKMNLSLDRMDFEQANLIDVKIDYDDSSADLVYVYEYNLEKIEYDEISDSYRLYDFFLLDLNDISEYNNKRRFVNNSDYLILKKLKESNINDE